MKVLNLYSGLGGQRNSDEWDKHSVTAVEINPAILKEIK